MAFPKVAENPAKCSLYREIKPACGLWISAENGGQKTAGRRPRLANPGASSLRSMDGPAGIFWQVFWMHTSLADAHTSDLWAAALELLEPRYNKPVFEMWLKPMRLVELTPNEIVLAVNTSFARDWVENRLKNDILGAEISLRVVVDAGPGTESVPTAVPARPPAMADDLRAGNLNPRYTF